MRRQQLILDYHRWDPVCIGHWWRVNIERVRNANVHVEYRAYVHSLRDLGVGPSHVAQALDLLIRDPIGVASESLNELQQQTLLVGYGRPAQVTVP